MSEEQQDCKLWKMDRSDVQLRDVADQLEHGLQLIDKGGRYIHDAIVGLRKLGGPEAREECGRLTGLLERLPMSRDERLVEYLRQDADDLMRSPRWVNRPN